MQVLTVFCFQIVWYRQQEVSSKLNLVIFANLLIIVLFCICANLFQHGYWYLASVIVVSIKRITTSSRIHKFLSSLPVNLLMERQLNVGNVVYQLNATQEFELHDSLRIGTQQLSQNHRKWYVLKPLTGYKIFSSNVYVQRFIAHQYFIGHFGMATIISIRFGLNDGICMAAAQLTSNLVRFPPVSNVRVDVYGVMSRTMFTARHCSTAAANWRFNQVVRIH